MGAAVFELSPGIAAYFIDEATANDDLYAAISGLAYVMPYRGFASSLSPTEAADAWAA